MELFESRQQFLNNLYSLITSDFDNKQALCVSIDAGWGYGKTFFLNKLSSKLKTNEQIVIEYNAWENDISDDAFLSFADTLISGLRMKIDKTDFVKKANDALEAFGKAVVKNAIESVGILSTFSKIISDTRENYISLNGEGTGFFQEGVAKTRLETVKEKLNESLEYFFDNCKHEYREKKIFILVDELDRCRPDFAIQVLERLKHLFSNNNLCFVFAINNNQLHQSIQNTFGNIDFPLYMEKFFDFSFVLPEPDNAEFVKKDISFLGTEKQKLYFLLLCQMVYDSGDEISPRQIERIFSHFNAICKMIADFDEYFKCPYLIPFAIYTKIVNIHFFHDFFKSGNTKLASSGTYDGLRKTILNKLVFSKCYGEGELFLVFDNIKEDEYGLDDRYCGGYLLNNGKYQSISNSRYINIADKSDLLKVYVLVSSLS